MLLHFTSGDTILGTISMPAREIAIVLTYIYTCSAAANDSAFDFISGRGNCILASHPPTPIYSWDFTPVLCRRHGLFPIAEARYWASSGLAAVRDFFRPHSLGGGNSQSMTFLHTCSGDQKRVNETANHHDRTSLCARPCPSYGTTRRSAEIPLSEVHSSDDRKDEDSILGTIVWLSDGEQRVASYISGLCSKCDQHRTERACNMHGRKTGTRHADKSPSPSLSIRNKSLGPQ